MTAIFETTFSNAFLEWKLLYFEENVIKICSPGFKILYSNTGSDNGLAHFNDTYILHSALMSYHVSWYRNFMFTRYCRYNSSCPTSSSGPSSPATAATAASVRSQPDWLAATSIQLDAESAGSKLCVGQSGLWVHVSVQSATATTYGHLITYLPAIVLQPIELLQYVHWWPDAAYCDAFNYYCWCGYSNVHHCICNYDFYYLLTYERSRAGRTKDSDNCVVTSWPDCASRSCVVL